MNIFSVYYMMFVLKRNQRILIQSPVEL